MTKAEEIIKSLGDEPRLNKNDMTIFDIAKQLAEAEELMRALGTKNQSIDYQERVKDDARYRFGH